MTELSTLISILVSGLTNGMILFLAAIGLTLVFGVLDVLNFAHGSLYMLGAYFTFFLVNSSWFSSNFWLSLIVAAILVAIVGALLERIVIQPIYDRPVEFQLLLTFALVLVIDNAVRIFAGTNYRSISVPSTFDFSVSVLGLGIPAYSLFLIVTGSIIALAIWLIFEKTLVGKTVRAASEDRDMSDALGVNVSLVFTGVFFLGSLLAALAGGLSAPLGSITPSMGEEIIIEAFIIVVIGGLGSLSGAFVGALLIGITSSLAFQFAHQYEPVIPFLLMALVLLIRPAGLFGEVKA